jgi:hypothetical protein
MLLFSRSSTGTALNNFSGKVYGFSIKDNGNVIQNLIPAKNSSNVIGMYDTVSGKFFTNAGTGEFIAGPESSNDSLVLQDAIKDSLKSLKAYGKTKLKPDTLLDTVVANGGTEIIPKVYFDSITANGGCEQRNLPAEYTQLEYLESTGTQYIDIGVAPKTTLSVKIKYNILQLTSQSNIAIFGSIATQTGLFSGVAGTPPVYYINNSSGSGSLPDIPVALNTILEEEYINATMIRNGVTYTTNPIIENNISMTLFGRNTGTEVLRIGTLRIYYFALYDNGVLIQNLIQAKRNSDNVLGMYDTATGNFLTNAGTGTFTAGPNAVPTPDNPIDIYCNNGALRVNINLYWTEYRGYELSQVDGITTKENSGVNVSGMVDCRTIKSFKITTISPQGAFRVFKYRADNTFINANSTANIGDIITLEDNVR